MAAPSFFFFFFFFVVVAVGDAATDSDGQINGPDRLDARCTCLERGRTWNRRDKCHTLRNLFAPERVAICWCGTASSFQSLSKKKEELDPRAVFRNVSWIEIVN